MTTQEEMMQLVAGGLSIEQAAIKVFGSYSIYHKRTDAENRQLINETRKRVQQEQRTQPNPFNFSVSCKLTQVYVPIEKREKLMNKARSLGMSLSKYLNGLISRDLQESYARELV